MNRAGPNRLDFIFLNTFCGCLNTHSTRWPKAANIFFFQFQRAEVRPKMLRVQRSIWRFQEALLHAPSAFRQLPGSRLVVVSFQSLQPSLQKLLLHVCLLCESLIRRTLAAEARTCVCNSRCCLYYKIFNLPVFTKTL